MEQGLRTRLQLRREELLKLFEDAKQLKARLGEEGAHVEELVTMKIKVKSLLESYEKDCLRACEYLKQDEQETFFKVQLSGEQILIEFDIIRELTKDKDRPGCSFSQHTTKLPKLQLQKFNGDILKWPEFWAQFESSVHNQNLCNADKLAYLFSSMDGLALEAVRGIDMTNENYDLAIDTLVKRFGDKDLVIDAHYEALNKLEKSSEANSRSTLDTINKHLRILKSLGEDGESNYFRNIICSKFPESIIYELNLLVPKERKLENILEILERIVQAKQRSSSKIDKPSTSTTEALHVRTFNRNQIKRKLPAERDQANPKRAKRQCVFCENHHFDDQCNKYKNIMLRKKRLASKRLCFKCFGNGHLARNCKRSVTCYYCKGEHNRALCSMLRKDITRGDKVQTPEDTSRPSDKQSKSKNSTGNNELTTLQANVSSCLQTATANLKHKENEVPLRLLLDCGSQRSYLTENIASKLKIIPDSQDNLVIFTFGSSTPQEIISPSAEVALITKRGIEKQIKVNIVPNITDRVKVLELVPDGKIDISADDARFGEKIDLLIGNDYYYSLLRNESHKIRENLHLINTDLGWIVSGQIEDSDISSELSVITYCQCHQSECTYFTEPDLPLRNVDMNFLWSLESIGIVDSPKATREEKTVKYFNETVTFQNGRYQVKWPWIEFPPILPTNFGLSFGRLKGLLKRADSDTLMDYQDILDEQLHAGVIEMIEPETIPIYQVNPPVHYIPYHIVRQVGKKGRLVYDASARLKDQRSLNECLYRGPSMLEDLTALLLQFRTGKIGITADIEKAFLQIGLQEPDRDVTRFLWVKNINKELTEDNLLHYRFCRVPFGIISSPFLLNATVRYHLSKTKDELLNKISRKFYVDNLVTNVNSYDEAVQLFSRTTKTFDEISMNIRDWVSNDRRFFENIPEKFRAKECKEIKVLGLIWNTERDTLKLKVAIRNDDNFTKGNVTKKDILKTLARVYDPCGFASPYILPIKLLFQETCVLKLKWDAIIPVDLQQTWQNSLVHLRAIEDIVVPRYVNSLLHGTQCKYEIHCFADASKNSYAAVAYLVARSDEKAATSILMSKSRITPVEDKDDLKIPRLELLALLIACRLLKYISSNLDLEIDRKYLWTDSLIVLAWLKTSKLLPPFVSRRVNEIKQSTDVEMRYVQTSQNPADIATRPDAIRRDMKLWFSGPSFLSQCEDYWPRQNNNAEQILFSAGEALDLVDGPEMSTKGYEDIEGVAIEIETHETSGSEQDYNRQEIRRLQADFFPEEVAGKATSLARNLSLFLDQNGILRCKGRMTNTSWSYDMKHPILLPKDCSFTEKIIQEVHEKNYHVGVPHTLSLVRRKFWIPQGRAKVQKILKRCPQCIKHGGGPYKLPPTPSLPAERVNYSSPFTYTGMDYFGPVFVSTSDGKRKRWICLFTCLAIRAIHLEVMADLTAEEGLMGLKRFIATRGKPNMIVSDNASQFRLMSEVLSGQDFRWKFIPQLAPWHGGVYERLIGLVKNCLKRTLEKHLLQDGQLMTVIKQVEAVVNTRPLTNVGADVEQILRPADFLSLGNCVELQPPEELCLEGTATKIDLLKSWKRGQTILNEFKAMFHGQYLQSLRERYRNHLKQPRSTSDKQPCVGDIVQIKGDSKNRNTWRVGRISSLIEGSDGLCRVAKVRVGDLEFTRSIGHLYPLEADSDVEIVDVPEKRNIEERLKTGEVREVREEGQPSISLPPPIPSSPVVEVEVPEQNNVGNDSNMTEVSDDIGLEGFPISVDEAEVEAVDSHPQVEVSSQAPEANEVPDQRIRREAAIRAREKIAEWTRHLLTVL